MTMPTVQQLQGNPAQTLFVVRLLALVIAFQLCSALATLIQRTSRRGVLGVANAEQGRTLKLLRRGLNIIPVAEHRNLYARYLQLQEIREVVLGARVPSYFAYMVPGVRGWLADVRILRAEVEIVYEKYESQDIGRMIVHAGEDAKLV